MGFTSWYNERIVPRLIRCACSGPAIMKLREKIVPLAGGAVLELGCGGGLNQRFYGRSRVRSYAGVDPSAAGLAFARAEAQKKGWNPDIRAGTGEAIPFADSAFDSVVCTFTLCSVDDPEQTISEMHRVLKPGGHLLFAEHGAAPDPGVVRWQTRIEPIWKRLAGGCHLTRPVSRAIEAGGFRIEPLGAQYAPGVPRFAGWMEWGVAVKAG